MEVASHPGLWKHPRTGIWWYRKAVPGDVRHLIGKREILRSFETRDRDEAKAKYWSVAEEAENRIKLARKGEWPPLHGELIDQLAFEWSQRVSKASEWSSWDRPPDPPQEFTPPALRDSVVQFLAERKLPTGDATVRRLIGAALPDPDIRVRLPEPVVLPLTKPEGPGIKLSDLLQRYFREKNPKPRTKLDWETTVRRFRELYGDLPVRQITKAHIVAFKDAILKLPARIQRIGLQDKTLPEIIEQAPKGVELVSLTTVQKAIGGLSAVFSYAVDNDHMEYNPCVGVKPKGRAKSERLPYSDEQLLTIFGSAVYKGCAGRDARSKPGRHIYRDACYWLPLLGLYTGCRLEELGQMLVSDVKREDGIDYLSINKLDEGKSLKTKHSARMVPIHRTVKRAGFIDYVKGLRTKGEKRLFPELRCDRHGKWTADWSKWWGRYSDALGITDSRLTFHSFRHTFKDACRRAKIAKDIHDALTGHSKGDVGSGYGLGFTLDVLNEAIQRIKYEAAQV